MFAKLFTFLSIFLLLLGVVGVHAAFAWDEPAFLSCSNPQSNNIIASYADGSHAIAGDQSMHTGSDTVYAVATSGNATQCFCPDLSGTDEGIQTNWWDVKDLNQDEITLLEGQGWISIANGADWGLQSDPYLAKNSAYQCICNQPTETPTPTASASASLTPTETPAPTGEVNGIEITATPTPASSSNGSSSSSSSSSPVQEVNALAFTGTTKSMIALLFLGIAAIGTGIYLKHRTVNK